MQQHESTLDSDNSHQFITIVQSEIFTLFSGPIAYTLIATLELFFLPFISVCKAHVLFVGMTDINDARLRGGGEKEKKKDKPNVPFAHCKSKAQVPTLLVSFRGHTCPRKSPSANYTHFVIASMSGQQYSVRYGPFEQ